MLKRKFLALLMIACLCASLFAVPGAMAGEGEPLLLATPDPQADEGSTPPFAVPVPLAGEQSVPISLEFVSVNKATGDVVVEVRGSTGGNEPVLFTWSNNATNNDFLTSTVKNFTFFGVQKGSYTLKVQYASGSSYSGTSNTITVNVPDPNEVKPIVINSASGGVERITASGTAEPGKSVILYIGTTVAAQTGLLDSDGKFTLSWNDSNAVAGSYSISVGPGSGYDTPVVPWNTQVKVTKPKAITIDAVRLEGRNSLRVIGSGYPGGTATLTTTPASPAKNIIIDDDGTFSEVISNLSVGKYHFVTATYYGSNPGQIGGPSYWPNTTAVDTWEVVDRKDDDIEITDVTPGIRSIVVTGKAKAGTTVKATVGTASGTQTVGNDGTFKITVTLAAGTYTGATVVYTTSPAPGSGASTSAKYTVTDGTQTQTPAPSTPTPSGGVYPTLWRGTTGSYVAALQQHLKSLGYYTIKVDGIFGVGTYTAVRNFQIMNNLPANGIADDAMQKLLYSGNAIGILPTTPPSGYTTLSYGSRGTAVRNMQVRLANLGYYYGSIDGIFGSQTQAAVRNFQNRNNLVVNGVADSTSQSAMYSASAIPNSNSSSGYVYLHYGSRGSAVTRLQTALKNLGYYKGSLDGQYYDQTYAAVKAFQRANGLVVDGIAGKKTQNRLYGTNY